MQLWIDTFDVAQGYGLVKQHFIERSCETAVDMVTVKNSDAYNPAGEMEVRQVFWIYARVRIDLQRVIVVSRILKESVLRVQHLM